MAHITIAVTGHRDVVENETLIAKVSAYVIKVCRQYQEVTLRSPLADGADRLLARLFLEYNDSECNVLLDVPMPFSKEQYIQTFSDASQIEFFSLEVKATKIYEVSKKKEHPYQNLGEYIVDTSDILLALWDGKVNHKLGGTADVVAYAKSKEHPVVQIFCERLNTK